MEKMNRGLDLSDLESIASAMNNGGPEAMSIVSKAAGDVLAEEWPNG